MRSAAAGGVREVVEDYRPVPGRQELGDDMRADVARAPGGQHCRRHPCFIMTWRGTV